MSSIGLRVFVALALIAATLPFAVSRTLAAGGDEPRPQEQTLLAGGGETVVSTDQAGIRVFGVEDGFDLDQYLYRSSSPLDFSIDLSADFGPVDSAGHPAIGNALFGRNARLTLRVEDVDENYAGTDVQPERDLVVVNGTTLDGYLSGASDQWSINTFTVPTSLLRLPTAENPSGRNDFQVLIDTANSGGDVWETSGRCGGWTTPVQLPVAGMHW